MTASTSLSLSQEIAIILRSNSRAFLPGCYTAEALEEAAKIVEREEKNRKSLAEMVRIVETLGLQSGLGKTQMAQLGRARALLKPL